MAKRAWMVRAGRDAILADQFEEKELVAIGFNLDDINNYNDLPAVKSALKKRFPEAKRMQIAVWAGQLWRLAKEIEPGDYLVTYLPASREYLIGQAADGYQYDPQAIDEYEGEYPHIRKVESWRRADRDQLSQSARNTLGAISTLFEVTKLLPELLAVAEGLAATEIDQPEPEEEEDETAVDYYEDVKARSDELIGDLLARLDGYEFEELTAALLRAMGYFVTQSAKGPDRGVDILAGPDPFHLEQPRIKVQVKKRESAADSNMIRSFIGILQSEDRGLFVSFGGYSKDARIEAERSNRPITLLDRLEFTRLLLEHYEKLEPEYQRQIPLKPVYLPTTTIE